MKLFGTDMVGCLGSLAREWGRIGSPGKLRCDPYGSAEEAGRALERLASAKRRKGYRDRA